MVRLRTQTGTSRSNTKRRPHVSSGLVAVLGLLLVVVPAADLLAASTGNAFLASIVTAEPLACVSIGTSTGRPLWNPPVRTKDSTALFSEATSLDTPGVARVEAFQLELPPRCDPGLTRPISDRAPPSTHSLA